MDPLTPEERALLAQGPTPEETPASARGSGPWDLTAYGTVRVKFSVQLGSLTAPVSRWETVTLGERLILPNSIRAPLTILVGDHPMGLGRIVRSGGLIAVEVTQWTDRDPSDPTLGSQGSSGFPG